jgi:hypothetical protein
LPVQDWLPGLYCSGAPDGGTGAALSGEDGSHVPPIARASPHLQRVGSGFDPLSSIFLSIAFGSPASPASSQWSARQLGPCCPPPLVQAEEDRCAFGA